MTTHQEDSPLSVDLWVSTAVAATAMAVPAFVFDALTVLSLLRSDWGVGLLDLATVLLPVVPVLIWTGLLAEHLRRRGGPGWLVPVAVVAWCVPGVNLVLPFLFLARVGRAAPSGAQRRVRLATVLAWWLGWVTVWLTVWSPVEQRLADAHLDQVVAIVAVAVGASAAVAGIVLLPTGLTLTPCQSSGWGRVHDR